MQHNYSLVSFFSGVSGSSLGWHNTGRINELLAIDCNDYVEKCFTLNFPGVPFWNTSLGKELSAQDIMNKANIKEGELDILAASPPCQGFSKAKGKRDIGDNRNDLYMDTINYILSIRPKCFVIENVEGLVTGNMKLRFNQLSRKIFNSEYLAGWIVLTASDYGVPQLRKRLFYLGIRKDIAGNDFDINSLIPKALSISKSSLSIKNYVEKDIDFFTMGQFDKTMLTKNDICRTITATPSMKFYKNGVERMPTITEIKRLCSFPDDFKLYSEKDGIDSKTGKEYNYIQKYHGLGNSVPPKLMEAIGNKIIQTINFNNNVNN
ncbi:MAG: DNA (cytosine-5-)-methyltransferase [Bacteroidales bacterium]|nr:DNA (cytosine-5-)-methyltransferase [Bacteroidales bacterium]